MVLLHRPTKLEPMFQTCCKWNCTSTILQKISCYCSTCHSLCSVYWTMWSNDSLGPPYFFFTPLMNQFVSGSFLASGLSGPPLFSSSSSHHLSSTLIICSGSMSPGATILSVRDPTSFLDLSSSSCYFLSRWLNISSVLFTLLLSHIW